MSGLVNKVKEVLHSDKDKSASHHHDTTTTGTHTTGTHTTGAHTTGTTHTTGAGLDNRGVHGPASGTDGPHNSNLMNKADPRVDSDRDHSHNMGANTAGNARTDNLHSGAGVSGMHSGAGVGGAGVGGAGVGGMHGGAPGAHHTTGVHGTTGTHGTTGVPGTTGTHGAYSASGPGPAPGTAGPHKSDVLNKADPRVDSNLDGSKTIGGDKTFAQ